MNSTAILGEQTASSLISRQLLNWAVWLMFATAFVVYIEPAPTDLFFAAMLVFFVHTRLVSVVGLVPLLLLLVVYNFGGLLGYLIAPPQPKAAMFIVTSAYMAVSAVVLALYVAADPLKHMDNIGKAWAVGAVIATIWGMIDYFQLPSPLPLQVLPGRATGLFKDPNVFSTFIIPPMIYMLQKLVMGKTQRPMLLAVSLTVIAIGLFLSFSRGAWMNFVAAALVMFALNFILFNDQKLRTRLFLYVVGALIVCTLAFLLLMSIPSIQRMFVERFALVQYYDAGETGRFGNQLRSIPELIKLPFGYGPLVFRTIYGNDPHNTYINAFAAYGWLGGISYFLLTISTLIIGAKTVVTKNPWQWISIAVYCPLVAVILQGVQIDTEHWRHYYWMLGAMWGLFAVTLQTPAHMLRPTYRADGLG
jgi:hypothetical protein